MWSDNVGAERSTAKGSARSFDHSCIVHCIWTKASDLNMQMFVDRVPTEQNVADLPSREQYELLKALGSSCYFSNIFCQLQVLIFDRCAKVKGAFLT